MTDAASTRILLAAASPSLFRVIEHLLREVPGAEILRSARATIASDAARLLPDVIVVSAHAMGEHGTTSAAELRRVSPGSRIVFITAGREWWEDEAVTAEADACLEEEDLVRGLLPIVYILSCGAPV